MRWRRRVADARPAQLHRIIARPWRPRSHLRQGFALGSVGFLALSFLLMPVVYGSWTQTLGVAATVQTAACRIAATVRIDPQHLNGGSSGQPVTVSIAFPAGTPAGVTVDGIAPASVTMRVQGGTATIAALAAPSSQGDHQRIVKFRRADVVGLLGGRSGEVTLVVGGPVGACTFAGSDTIDYAPATADTPAHDAATAGPAASPVAAAAPQPAAPGNSAATTPVPSPSGTTGASDTASTPVATPGTSATSATATPATSPPGSTPTPTPTPEAAATNGATATPTPTPTATATPGPEPASPVPTAEPTATTTPTPTSTPAATPAPSPTATAVPPDAVTVSPIPGPPAPAPTADPAPTVTPPPLPSPATPPAPPVSPGTVIAGLQAPYGSPGQVCARLQLRSLDPADVGKTVVLALRYLDARAGDWAPTGSTVTMDLVAGQLRYDACLTIPDALHAPGSAGLLRLEVDPATTADLSGPVRASDPLPWVAVSMLVPAAPTATPAGSGPHSRPPDQP